MVPSAPPSPIQSTFIRSPRRTADWPGPQGSSHGTLPPPRARPRGKSSCAGEALAPVEAGAPRVAILAACPGAFELRAVHSFQRSSRRKRRKGRSVKNAGLLVVVVAGLVACKTELEFPPAQPRSNFGRTPRHTAVARVSSQNLRQVHWSAAVDTLPLAEGEELRVHYGTPLATRGGTIVVPIRTWASEVFPPEL